MAGSVWRLVGMAIVGSVVLIIAKNLCLVKVIRDEEKKKRNSAKVLPPNFGDWKSVAERFRNESIENLIKQLLSESNDGRQRKSC